MSVWVCAPSKRSQSDVDAWANKWRLHGYRVAVVRDQGDSPVEADEQIWTDKYPGYARAANMLVSTILQHDNQSEWCVVAGDDVLPDPNHTAEEIAIQCSQHFAPGGAPSWNGMEATFGVMQPIGDEFGAEPNNPDPHLRTPYIHRVAGSPWIGREFARRMYQGKGPYWPEYTHMGVDEELQAVAIKYGVFWQRLDLIHFHKHWGRPRQGERYGQASRMPAFLEKANSGGEWKRYKRIYTEREAAGFPGSEPL